MYFLKMKERLQKKIKTYIKFRSVYKPRQFTRLKREMLRDQEYGESRKKTVMPIWQRKMTNLSKIYLFNLFNEPKKYFAIRTK